MQGSRTGNCSVVHRNAEMSRTRVPQCAAHTQSHTPPNESTWHCTDSKHQQMCRGITVCPAAHPAAKDDLKLRCYSAYASSHRVFKLEA